MIFWGVGAGLGGLLIRQSLRRPALATVLPKYGSGATASHSQMQLLVRLIEKHFSVSTSDLAMCDRTLTEVTTERLLGALIGAVLPLAMLVLTTLGGSGLPLPLLMVCSLILAVLGFMLPVIQLRTRASARRREFRTALSAFLDLVSIMLAGGAGIETALVSASRVGDGETFTRIADALDVARSRRQSLWEVLAVEGERLGIEELPELAATIRLGGEQGARMTASLVAKASSMRSKQLAEIEAQANSATERMGLPMVLLFLGFLVLLGYPALQMINSGFGSQ